MRYIIKLLVVAAFSFSCVAASGAAEALLLAPGFSLQDVKSEKTYSLSDYKGKQAVILFFWTTWCPFCRREIRTLNSNYQKLAADGVEVLAINSREAKGTVENFLRGQTFDFKVLLDSDAKATDEYDIVGVPTYIFVDKEGLVVFKDHYFPEDKYKELLLD